MLDTIVRSQLIQLGEFLELKSKISSKNGGKN
jgi:hypothetical protein